jgi:hypothetical protein
LYIIYDYQPNIKSDTWPNMPFPGDCPAGNAFGNPIVGGALCVTPAFCRPSAGGWPGFINAAADGANLIGVPYEGMVVCAWTGGTSSTAIEFGDGGSTGVFDTNPRPVVWARISFARAWSYKLSKLSHG